MPGENGANLSLAKEIEGRSCWLFDRSGKFRAVCRDLATSPRFERVVLTAIFGTCVLLALDRPALSAGSPELVTIFIIEAVLNSFYVFEISVKCVAHTFVGFVSAGYNPIDFFVTVTSALDTTLTLILVPKSIFGHDELDTEVCSSSNRISMSPPRALNPIGSVKLKSILEALLSLSGAEARVRFGIASISSCSSCIASAEIDRTVQGPATPDGHCALRGHIRIPCNQEIRV